MNTTEKIKELSEIKKANFQNKDLSFTKHYSDVKNQLRADFERVLDTYKYTDRGIDRYFSREDFAKVKAVLECVIDSSCLFLDRDETGYCNKSLTTMMDELMMRRNALVSYLQLLTKMGYLIKVARKGKSSYYFAVDTPPSNEEALKEIESTRREVKPKKVAPKRSQIDSKPSEEEVRPITPKEDKIECEPIVEEIEGVHVEKTQTEMIMFLEAYDNHLEGVSNIYDDLVAKINALDSYNKEFVIDMAKRFRQEIRDKFNDEQITAFYEKIICEINFC